MKLKNVGLLETQEIQNIRGKEYPGILEGSSWKAAVLEKRSGDHQKYKPFVWHLGTIEKWKTEE